MTDLDIDALEAHACASGTQTAQVMRDAILNACSELRRLRATAMKSAPAIADLVEVSSSLDPAWRAAILGSSDNDLRERVYLMMLWAESRISHDDRELADRGGTRTLEAEPAALIHATERTALVAVLTQLAGDDS